MFVACLGLFVGLVAACGADEYDGIVADCWDPCVCSNPNSTDVCNRDEFGNPIDDQVEDPAEEEQSCKPPIDVKVTAIDAFDADGEPVELELDNLLVRSYYDSSEGIRTGHTGPASLPYVADSPTWHQLGEITFWFEMPGEVWTCEFDAADFRSGVGEVTCPTKLGSATPIGGPSTATTVITYENQGSPRGDFCTASSRGE